MKFIELFAGIGAFRLGLERTGHECVWANEWEEPARRIYEKQFGHRPDPRDVRTINADDLPEADLLVGGFPCATFSVAGKRTGFSLEDTRGTLAFEMFRLARDKEIPYILFENVKGLLNHDNGRTFGIILRVLDELGYDSQWELLDSQNFGIPQHRERIFLVANLRTKPRPKVFPIGRTDQTDVSEVSTDTVEVAQWRRGFFRKYKSSGVPTLTANMGTGGHNVPFVTGRNPRERDVFPTIDGHYWKGIQNNQGRGAVFTDGEIPKIRKLTPLECERLQGFPDDFTKYYEDGSLVSNSVRYERCGRTITIPVVEAIGRNLHVFF
jgi:DNA (cytosine-5)-methyltransferase 1